MENYHRRYARAPRNRSLRPIARCPSRWAPDWRMGFLSRGGRKTAFPRSILELGGANRDRILLRSSRQTVLPGNCVEPDNPPSLAHANDIGGLHQAELGELLAEHR